MVKLRNLLLKLPNNEVCKNIHSKLLEFFFRSVLTIFLSYLSINLIARKRHANVKTSEP